VYFDDTARSPGLRIIGVDRPGCGGSSPQPSFTFLSYATDLREVQDQLRIEAGGARPACALIVPALSGLT
jgi:pimeloyl-ACP methyl ester carboxylesterase